MADETLDIERLDPGIRREVMALRAAGFETTDSGDGVSKPADWYESGEALPFPHICGPVPPRSAVSSLEWFANDIANRLGPPWRCEVNFDSDSRKWLFIASRPPRTEAK